MSKEKNISGKDWSFRNNLDKFEENPYRIVIFKKL